MAFWLIKSDPEEYSWDDLNRDKFTVWDGVRNYQARNYLKSMKAGELVLFYHSRISQAIVGIAEVIRTAFPDLNADEPDWYSIEIAPLRSLKKLISLEHIKATDALSKLPLILQPRLSVMPISEDEFKLILELSN
ncbi:MAG: EVE domain-containing protein [Candidatus Kapabacteria bacterium]|nr:EVE domain-containing protein [Candidatus Kapabacteria bacterium]